MVRHAEMDMETRAHLVPDILAQRIRDQVDALGAEEPFYSRRIHYDLCLYRGFHVDIPLQDGTTRVAAEELLCLVVAGLTRAGAIVYSGVAALPAPEEAGNPAAWENAHLDVAGVIEIPDPSDEAQDFWHAVQEAPIYARTPLSAENWEQHHAQLAQEAPHRLVSPG